MNNELTIHELASDPLIAMVMRADGVGEQDLADLISRVAQGQVKRLQLQINRARANDFYTRLDDRSSYDGQGLAAS